MIQDNNDVCKEVFTILSFFSNDLLDKVPNTVIEKIGFLAMNSDADFHIDRRKSLKEQNISEESKDFISLIYYNYIADEKEKGELLELWNGNENKYQDELEKKYNSDNLFPNRKKEVQINNTDMVMADNKENLFSKIKNIIRKIFKNKKD